MSCPITKKTCSEKSHPRRGHISEKANTGRNKSASTIIRQ